MGISDCCVFEEIQSIWEIPVEMIKLAPSLGETRTTISHPAKTSHRSLSPEERVELGIGDGLIRMSCGIESAADIVADIEQALRKT